VTLAAAEDNDIVCGTACFACSAAGWIGATVTVSEVDNDTNATLVVNASAGGVTTPSGTNTVLIGATFEINQQTPISIMATPDPGYAFVNWTTSTPGCAARITDANTANTTVRVVAYGATVQANFEVIADPHGDNDGDGMDNLAESIAGTDPRDNRSLLKITGLMVVPEGVIIDWKGGQAARQRLEVCSDLVTPATGTGWTTVYSNVNLPTPVTNSFIHAGCANSNRFYRIKAER
jgi:hypothetical protein